MLQSISEEILLNRSFVKENWIFLVFLFLRDVRSGRNFALITDITSAMCPVVVSVWDISA